MQHRRVLVEASRPSGASPCAQRERAAIASISSCRRRGPGTRRPTTRPSSPRPVSCSDTSASPTISSRPPRRRAATTTSRCARVVEGEVATSSRRSPASARRSAGARLGREPSRNPRTRGDVARPRQAQAPVPPRAHASRSAPASTRRVGSCARHLFEGGRQARAVALTANSRAQRFPPAQCDTCRSLRGAADARKALAQLRLLAVVGELEEALAHRLRRASAPARRRPRDGRAGSRSPGRGRARGAAV